MDDLLARFASFFPAGYLSRLETTGWYALGIPLLALLLYTEARRRPESVGFAEPLSNLQAGISTLVLGVIVGPVVFRLYEFGYARAIVHWGDSWLRWPAALLVSDFCYYLHHRAGHRFAFLWAIHGVHHQHERLNSTVGLRLEWLADVSTIVFFAPMPLLGFDATTGFLAFALLSLFALTTHCPLLARPPLWLFITPATHGAHHSRDARYLDTNFASMFTLWDRLFGTYREARPGEVLRVDVPTICRRHDGVGAQLSLFRELIGAMRAAGSARAALRLAFARPVLPERPPETPRPESAIAPPLRTFLVIDFLATAAFVVWLLWARGAGSTFATIAAAALAIFSLHANGRLLDGRADAVRTQAARLVGAVVVAAVLLPRHAVVAALLVVGSAMIGVWLMVRPEVTQAPAR